MSTQEEQSTPPTTRSVHLLSPAQQQLAATIIKGTEGALVLGSGTVGDALVALDLAREHFLVAVRRASQPQPLVQVPTLRINGQSSKG